MTSAPRLARLVVVDLWVGGGTFALATGSVLAATVMGSHPLLALAVLALATFRFVREVFRAGESELKDDPPPSARIDSTKRTAAKVGFRMLPGLVVIIVFPAALAAWLWDPVSLIAAGAVLVWFGGEYLAAAIRVSRWEHLNHALSFQSWPRPFRGERPIGYAVPIDEPRRPPT